MIDPGHYPRLIGKRLRELRLEHGYTCCGVGRLTGIAPSSVSATELGKACCPTLNTLAKYAALYDVPVLDLLVYLQPSLSVAAPPCAGSLRGEPQAVQPEPTGLSAASDPYDVVHSPGATADSQSLVVSECSSGTQVDLSLTRLPGSADLTVGGEPC
jgi:transcriptional regulator with XRE-family HTH domain